MLRVRRSDQTCVTDGERHSALEARFAGVRAAMLPGTAATRLASTKGPRAITTTGRRGTLGSGTASISWAKSSHRERPGRDAQGHADDCAGSDSHCGLPSYGGCQLAVGKPKGFQEGEVVAPTSDRGDQGEAESDRRAGGKGATKQVRRGTKVVIGDDLSRPLRSQQGGGRPPESAAKFRGNRVDRTFGSAALVPGPVTGPMALGPG